MSFTESLKAGQLGESEISRFMIRRGWQVLPAYEVEQGSGKGPRLFGEYGQLISPDLLVFRGEQVQWVEAKTKSAFTWYRVKQKWQTGIDLRHWRDYLKVNASTPFPVWLLFLHRHGMAKDTPFGMVSPTGLFGNKVAILQGCADHISEKHGPSGMIYWNIDNLKLIAAIDQICPNQTIHRNRAH